MNWLYTSFLLIHLINHVWTFDASSIPSSNSDDSIEIPKPINPMVFDELDTSYRKPKKLKWQTDKSKKPSMVDIALEVAAREGIHAMTDLYQNIEPQIVKNGQILEDNHPAALLSKFSAPIEGNERSAMAAFATLSATKAFRRNNKELAVLGRQAQSQKVSFRRTPLEGLCPARDPPTCMPASQRYRTHDGTCNNRRRLRWGSAQMPFNRFLPPEYGDGVDSIRGSVEGGALSSARFVSLLVHGAREGDAPLTLMIVQWGQLLDHDMTSTAQPRSINGSVPSCCGSKDFHPLCFPIKVPLDDPWLAPLKVRCLEFLRSAPAQRRDCVLSWREQTNQVTSYIDASPIYSSNAKTSDNARIFRNGLLIYGRGDPADDVCMRGAIAHQCIRSGDGRSGEQPGLLALHHVWVGEHNRIAMELSILNPHWSDEKVYQETRRIIGALFQHITFREFLPIVLGREVCKLFDLELVKSGYYSGYDSNINPSMSNAFAAAAFRFGHSLVQNTYMRADRNHVFINNNVTLHEEFQQGDIGTAGSLHRLIRGLASQKALKRDEFITPELTNHLFQTPGFPFGLDLAAINIQRGRDHGIAPYTAWRQPCGLSAINSWDDLSNVVGPESSKRISHAYRNVHDIDLFVGGIAERPVIGGLVGPTFACIIAQQFSNSRKGDRFWYENSGFESSFTPAQLNALRHVSLSSVLCRAVNGGTLQPYVFLPNDVKGNQRVKCGKESLEPIDLRPWLEQDPFLMSNNEKIDKNVAPQSITPISTQSTVKEEKGINNRIQNVTMVANVDFIPNSSIGFHRVTNMTKIHDKLDMAQKLVAARPSLKPIRGINNKLDKNRLTVKKNPKPTAASKRISTTRRTVVIHNVQIELRSANGATNMELKNKKTAQQQNSMASTAQNTILKVAGVVKSQISAALGLLSDTKNDDASTKHLSRKMNDQSESSIKELMNLTNLTNNITAHGTFIQTQTTNNNLTAGRFSNSDSELKVENPSGKPTTGQVSNDNQDKEVTSLTETNFKTKEKLNETLNIAKNLTIPTKLTNTTKDLNKNDHAGEELTNSRIETSKKFQKPDICAQNIDTSKNSHDETDLTNNNCTITNSNIVSERNANKTPTKADNNKADGNTLNQMTTDQNSIITDRNTSFESNLTVEQLNEHFSDNLRDKLDETFNMTNNLYIPTKWKNSTKELNKINHAEEELTNSKIKTSTNFLTSTPCTQNSDKTNLTDNYTITNSNIDSERNNSKTPTKQNFKDKNDSAYKLNENTPRKMTTNQNNEHLIADRNKSNLNDEQLKEDFSGNLKEKLNETFNITKNLTTQTKLTNPTKELNKTDHAEEELLTNSKIETNLLNPDPCTQNFETSKNNNEHTDLTNNYTINNSNTDSEGNDRKAPTKENNKDCNNLAYILNGKTAKDMTIYRNNEQLLTTDDAGNTSEDPLDKSNNETFFQLNLNDEKLNEYDFSENSKEIHDTYKDFQDLINSALQDSLDQHKRVHRKTDHKNNVQVEKVEFHTNLDFIDKLRTLRLDKKNDFPESELTSASKLDRKSELDLKENYFTESDDLTLPINTEQPSATLRNVELRQYQERPIYNRPSQQLLIDAPKSDQYEIEINIRQTNTKKPQNNANYEDYNSPNKRYDNDRYNHQYDYTTYPHQNSPSSNGFFTPTTRIPYGTRTKPPTIIYIDEHDIRSTTRGPGIFQNIISFATSGLNSIKQQTTSTKSPFNHNPNRIINSGQNSVSENYLSSHSSYPYQNSKPGSSNYLGGQQGQTYPPTQGFPQHGFSQGPPNFNPANIPPQGFPHQNIYPPQALPGANSFSTASNIGGVSHASSNAVSTGHFGAIVGSASSSGGDSTFSFNIRPSPRPQLNLMSPAGIKPDYEFLPQHRPQFSSTPSYAIPPKPMPSASVESFEYPPNKHDPFSSYTRKPPSYYNKPTNVFDPAYDDIGRSELKINDAIDHDHHKTNQTNENFDSDDYDYNDDDDDRFRHIFKNNNAVDDQSSGKNDKIDYLKLAEQALTNRNRTKLNITELDDNFVLPVLRRNDKFIEAEEEEEELGTTTMMTGEQKSLGYDILAEDYDELLIARSSFLDSQTSYVTGQWNKLTKSPPPSVAFAPIQILTKPERPDNWVIFDAIDEQPLLPVQPDFNTDTLVAAEVPMPIQKRKISRTSTKTPETTKPTDINFSTDTSTFDMTTTSEQSLDEITTESIIDEITTSVEHLTQELDEITQTTQPTNTMSEISDLNFEKERQELLNFQTEDLNEKIDHIQTEHSTDIPAITQETNTFTDGMTDELTTLPNLT